jgi:predicted DNA-binding transcriptional regulator AlpA
LTDKAFRQEFPVGLPDNRLASAIARGIPARRKLMETEGGSLSAEQAAQALGMSKAAILKRYKKGRIIAWREERQNAVRFPVWQFKDHRVLGGIEEALKALNAGSRLDDLGRMLFFLSNRGFLGGKRPLDCLREGEVKRVLQAAQGYGG